MRPDPLEDTMAADRLVDEERERRALKRAQAEALKRQQEELERREREAEEAGA